MNQARHQQLASATALYQQGDLHGALALLNNIILQHPDFIEAHFHLGCLLQASGQLQNALARYEHTLSAQPNYIDALINMGNVLIALNQPEQALVRYNQALQLQPNHADLLSNRGHLLTQLKRYDEARISLDHALLINANHFSALINKGLLLCSQEQWEAALESFNHALIIEPNDFTTLANRSQTLVRLKKFEEALLDCQHILHHQPHNVDMLKLMVNILVELKRYHEAITIVDRILFIEPNNEQLFFAQANLYKFIREYEKSLPLFTLFLTRQPNHVSALIDRGNVFSALDQLENAVNDFDRVIAIEPTNVAAWMNKAIVFNKCRLHKQATECYEHVIEQLPDDAGARVAVLLHLQHMCDWQSMDKHTRVLKDILAKPDYLESYQLSRAMPSTLLSLPNITPQEQLLFAKKYTSIMSPVTYQRTFPKRLPHQKIHIGYFSSDFNQHPVSQLMVEVLELHDRENFKISAYSARESDKSAMRTRVEKAVDSFVDITTLSDALALEKMIADQLDIVVDLSGYTEASRSELLALRPAPIQVNYLGYLGTMGADFIDYIIADDFLISAGQEIFYSERVVRLPSYQANDRQCVVGKKPSRAECHLPEDAIVFCCFNINYKITPDFFDVWCKLLINVPSSVLWLFTSTDEPMNNLRKEASTRGVDPTRLIFAPWIAIEDHLARIACADLFLDTAPYNAGTTASNALRAGLPIVTCAGQTFSSRMAGSLLTAIGVPELITYNLDDYYQLAFELATQHHKRTQLREKIIANKDTSLLFDSVQFTYHLENAYRHMMLENKN